MVSTMRIRHRLDLRDAPIVHVAEQRADTARASPTIPVMAPTFAKTIPASYNSSPRPAGSGNGGVTVAERLSPSTRHRRHIMRCALHARVSTTDQTCDNQLFALRRYVEARGWRAVEFVDHAVSATRESRPALDALMKAVRRRQVDTVVVFALDRLGRSLSHLIRVIEDWQGLGVSLVSLRDGLDLGSASGRLQLHVLAALAQFERERLRERVVVGLQGARAPFAPESLAASLTVYRVTKQPFLGTEPAMKRTAAILVAFAAVACGKSSPSIPSSPGRQATRRGRSSPCGERRSRSRRSQRQSQRQGHCSPLQRSSRNTPRLLRKSPRPLTPPSQGRRARQ
jgi:DNA invertase Pin-like site-specific DNA recombinase